MKISFFTSLLLGLLFSPAITAAQESVKDYYYFNTEELLRKYQESLHYQRYERPATLPEEYFYIPEVIEHELIDELPEIIVDPTNIFAHDADGLNVTRADFIQTVMELLYPNAVLYSDCLDTIDSNPHPPQEYSLLFNDVHKDAPYAQHLCLAMEAGLIQGYSDGSFRPNRPINFAEAAKILVRAAGIPYALEGNEEAWYLPYVYALSLHNAIPTSMKNMEQSMSAEEARDLTYRILYELRYEPSNSYYEMMQ